MVFKLPKAVHLKETVVRDGFQHERQFIPTQTKIQLINQLVEAGYRHIEVTSFSNPRNVPQFRDAEEVLKGIKRKPGVVYQASTVTPRAVQRAIEAAEKGFGPNMGTWGVSTSESHCLRNFGMPAAERFAQAKKMLEMTRNAGVKLSAGVMTVWGCPIEGPVPIERAIEFTERYIDIGFDLISHCDTTGEGTPDRVYDYLCRVLDRYPNVTHSVHFHESRGWGLANCLAALQTGVTYFDSAMGGLGGQPANVLDGVPVEKIGPLYTPSDITGNIRSEDLVVMLDEMGVETGLDVDRILDIGRSVEKIVGRRLRSYCTETGRIPKGPTGR